jgi:peptide subunit release factor 1 (eRF1)
MNYMGIKSILFKVFGLVLSLYIILWLSFATLTDNQISSYVKSKFITNKKNYPKIIRLDQNKLKSLFENNPNTKFYFSSSYCGYCNQKLSKANHFDSLNKIKELYVICDNEFSMKSVASLLQKNNQIKNVYYLDDKYFGGMTHTKAWNVVKEYLPNYKGKLNYFPFSLITDSNGNVTRLK